MWKTWINQDSQFVKQLQKTQKQLKQEENLQKCVKRKTGSICKTVQSYFKKLRTTETGGKLQKCEK